MSDQETQAKGTDITLATSNALGLAEGVTLEDIQRISAIEHQEANAAQKELAEILKNFQKQAAKMVGENESIVSFSDALSEIRNGDSIKDYAVSTGRAISVLAKGIPGIKHGINYMGSKMRGNAQIGHALKQQYELTDQAVELIRDAVFSENNGLITHARKVHESMQSCMDSYRRGRETIEDRDKEIVKLAANIEKQRVSFEAKYGVEVNEENLPNIPTEGVDAYMAIQELETEHGALVTLQEDANADCEEFLRTYAGKKALLKNLEASVKQGKRIYNQGRKLLDEAQVDLEAAAQNAQYVALLSSAGTALKQLKDNYNATILITSDSTLKLAEMGESVAPTNSYDLQTLVQLSENEQKAAMITHERKPTDNLLAASNEEPYLTLEHEARAEE